MQNFPRYWHNFSNSFYVLVLISMQYLLIQLPINRTEQMTHELQKTSDEFQEQLT